MHVPWQVLWCADLLTNTVILQRFELLSKTQEEFLEIARGERLELSADCRAISCLPPAVIGLFESWDLTQRHVAEALGVTPVAISQV